MKAHLLSRFAASLRRIRLALGVRAAGEAGERGVAPLRTPAEWDEWLEFRRETPVLTPLRAPGSIFETRPPHGWGSLR